MMDVVLKRSPWPMVRRPDPPVTDRTVQVSYYRARCLVDHEQEIYVVIDDDDREVHRSSDWDDLCDLFGWFPRSPIIKTPAQEQRALEQRQANAVAAAAGKDLPFPNPWDQFIDKPDPEATVEERYQWHREFAAQHDPKHDDTIVAKTSSYRITHPTQADPLPERPTPPAVGEQIQIGGYQITAKLCKGVNRDAPIYHLRSRSGELLSMAYDWDRWCHELGWYPIDGLERGQKIPREPMIRAPALARPTGPHVRNRHHYKSRDEIPEPWFYVGRGAVLGNEFTAQEYGRKEAMNKYRRWLWDRIVKRDPVVLAELGKITAETSLVCSCAPSPCHADTIIKAWKWAKSRSVLDGYRTSEGEADPDWATEIDPEDPKPPVIEKREETKNLDLFGGDP